MKKRELIVGAIALTASVSGMVSVQAAYAALTCTAGTASAPMTCSGETGTDTYLAQAVAFTGSNGVDMSIDDSTDGVALCGWHISGRNSYGLSTNGGSMNTVVGTGTATADLTAGGCSAGG